MCFERSDIGHAVAIAGQPVGDAAKAPFDGVKVPADIA